MKDIMDSAAATLNFTYEVKFRNYSGWYGKQQSTGDWTGILGMVQRGEADFCLLPFGYNPERYDDFHMTNSFFISEISLLSGRGIPSDEANFTFMKVMTYEVWTAYWSSFLIIAVINYLFHRGIQEKTSRFPQPRLWNYTWNYFETIFGYQLQIPLIEVSTKILVIFWLVATFVITSYLKSTLRANLTVFGENNIDNLDNVLLHPRMKFHTVKDSIHAYNLENSENGVYKQIWKKIKKEKSLLSIEDMASVPTLKNTAERKSVLFYSKPFLQSSVVKMCPKGCTYYMSKEAVMQLEFSMLFSKKISKEFMETINVHLLRIYETRHSEIWLRRLIGKFYPCFPRVRKNALKILKFTDLASVFFLWSGGILLADLAFLWEKLWFYFNEK